MLGPPLPECLFRSPSSALLLLALLLLSSMPKIPALEKLTAGMGQQSWELTVWPDSVGKWYGRWTEAESTKKGVGNQGKLHRGGGTRLDSEGWVGVQQRRRREPEENHVGISSGLGVGLGCRSEAGWAVHRVACSSPFLLKEPQVCSSDNVPSPRNGWWLVQAAMQFHTPLPVIGLRVVISPNSGQWDVKESLQKLISHIRKRSISLSLPEWYPQLGSHLVTMGEDTANTQGTP